MTARALGFASGITVTGNVTTGASQIDLTQFVGDMIGNITAANSAVSGLLANITAANSAITAANSAITTANSAMRSYVDTQVASAVIQAGGYGNSVVAAYLPINSTITSIQANVTAANANIISTQSNVTAANASITSLRANITAANAAIAAANITVANIQISELRANIAAANANIISLQSNTIYMTSNVGGSVFTNNVYLGEGNLVVGNINASGNLVMRGTDATTIRFVRSPDTTVTSGEIYGNIDFASEDSTGGASGIRARMSVESIGSQGQTAMKFYTGDGSSFGGGFAIGPTFITNSEGYYGDSAGFQNQVVPQFYTTSTPGLDPYSNDSSMSYISGLQTSGLQKFYGGTPGDIGFYDLEVIQTFIHNYAGFAGGDRANIALSAYLSIVGSTAMIDTDDGHTDLDISVQGLYTADPAASPLVQKRLRKQWVATISYSSATSNYTILDQQLQSPVYHSDATNWSAGAVASGKVLLQANATPGYGGLYLRLDSPTAAAATSVVKWQWTVKYRKIKSA
jgi:hypothetical protein